MFKWTNGRFDNPNTNSESTRRKCVLPYVWRNVQKKNERRKNEDILGYELEKKRPIEGKVRSKYERSLEIGALKSNQIP